MKKLALMMALCVLFAGCAEQPVPPESPEAPPSVTASLSPSVESSPSPEPTPELPAPVLLPDIPPYDDYFSEEQKLPRLDVEMAYMAYKENDKGQVVRLYDNFIVSALFPEKLFTTWSIPGYGAFLVVENTSIYFLAETSTEPMLAYESSRGELSWINLAYPLLTFAEGNMAMRMFVPDFTVDELCDVTVDNWFEAPVFSVASNVTVVWSVKNPEFDPEQPDSYLNRTHISRFYNTLTKEMSEDQALYPGYDEYY